MTINFIFFTIIIKKNKDNKQLRFEEAIFNEVEQKKHEAFSHMVF